MLSAAQTRVRVGVSRTSARPIPICPIAVPRFRPLHGDAPSREGAALLRSPSVQPPKAIFGLGTAAPPLDPNSPEQLALRSSAGWQKSLSFVGFWLQLALTLVSAGILIFSLAATNQTGPTWPRYFTAGGIVCAFLSTFFAHGFLRLARKLAAGEAVAPGWIGSGLLRNNQLNVLGIAITVVGLQASVGTLVTKSLSTSNNPFAAPNAANALVSLDVFSLQAATNTLLCHVVSLVFTNLMLGIVNKTRGATAQPISAVGAVTVDADGAPVRPGTLGVNPWTLKAD